GPPGLWNPRWLETQVRSTRTPGGDDQPVDRVQALEAQGGPVELHEVEPRRRQHPPHVSLRVAVPAMRIQLVVDAQLGGRVLDGEDQVAIRPQRRRGRRDRLVQLTEVA